MKLGEVLHQQRHPEMFALKIILFAHDPMSVKNTWKTQKNKTSIEIVVVPNLHLSIEKNWLFSVYRGLYYPVICGF